MHDTVHTGRTFSWFTATKYMTYALLTVNVFLFLAEEMAAFQHTFGGSLENADFIQVFSATIDTAAWVVLLLLFELETSVIPDEKIRGGVRLALHGIRIFCYVFICYAFYGYLRELLFVYNIVPADLALICADGGAGWSLLVDLDEYIDLDAATCAQLTAPISQFASFDIVAEQETLLAAQKLAWTDQINSGAWLLVVLILEIDVRLQLRGGEEDWLVKTNRLFKTVLYTTLLGCAAYWGYAGDFLDFWDAFLWLFAFVFIELNVFDWQAEVQAEAAAH